MPEPRSALLAGRLVNVQIGRNTASRTDDESMKQLTKLWNFIVLRNASGLACLATVWAMGFLYYLAAIFDLIPGANTEFAVRFCLASGPVLFFVVPILERIFERRE